MNTTRQLWLDAMLKIAHPVLDALSRDRLKAEMPVRGKQAPEVYAHCTYLEAFGRTLMGIAPWLGCRELTGEEEALRQKYAAMARRCLDVAVDPTAADRLNFSEGGQPIVDAAFLAQGILRAPNELWEPLSPVTKARLLDAMRATRSRCPGYNNWLLFSAMIECLIRYGGGADWDPMRVDYAIRSHMQWYKGDGVYGDGPKFHWDYYNSYVIQPMLIEAVEQTGDFFPEWQKQLPEMEKRLSHYATIQEHLISPEGTYPLLGRSLCYRFGAFQCLSMAAWRHQLENTVTPAGVRGGLTAVIRRTMDFSTLFDENGWLTVGVCGSQPGMGEAYISTGSLYLCCAVFLPLGLPENDPFWSDPDTAWTMQSLWNGEDRECEHWIP